MGLARPIVYQMDAAGTVSRGQWWRGALVRHQGVRSSSKGNDMDLIEGQQGNSRRHPWEEARFEFFAAALSERRLLTPDVTVLDVGAGDGWFARSLLARAPQIRVTCWDSNYEAIDCDAAPDGVAFTRAAPPGRFDVVLMLDVLEHVEDDAAFLCSIVHERVRPGGALLFSVPAWQRLFSRHDTALKHFRRYRPFEAERLLCAAGLEILVQGGLFHSLLVPRAASILAENTYSLPPLDPAASSRWQAPRWVTACVRAALRADNAVSRLAAASGVNLPGLSYWALATRRA